MSWSIYAFGNKAGVQKKVGAVTLAESYPEVEKAQFAQAKELLLTTLKGNTDDKFFKVEASGSATSSGGVVTSNSVKVNIETVNVDV